MVEKFRFDMLKKNDVVIAIDNCTDRGTTKYCKYKIYNVLKIYDKNEIFYLDDNEILRHCNEDYFLMSFSLIKKKQLPNYL